MTQDAHMDAFRRLLADGAQGGQAKVDALVALVQRTVFVAPWPHGVDGYRTLVNSQRSAALPIFTDRNELENAGRRFGWFAPDGTIPGIEIGARAALSYAKTQGLAYVVVDIAANHCLEVGRDEIEPLLAPSVRKESGPFAASGRVSSSLHQAVRPQPGAPSGPPPAQSVQMGLQSSTMPRMSQPSMTAVKPPAAPTAPPVPPHARVSQPNAPFPAAPPSRPVVPNPLSRPGTIPTAPSTSGSAPLQMSQPVRAVASASQPVGAPTGLPRLSDVRGPVPLTKTGASLPRMQIPEEVVEPMLENPPYAAVVENDVPTLRTSSLVGTALPSVEMGPPLSPPSDAILDRLEETFRNYPEIEWACIGSVDRDTAVGLRIDSRMRKRIQEIANEIAVVTAPNAFISVLLDAPNHLRKARNDSLLFYPWRRKV